MSSAEAINYLLIHKFPCHYEMIPSVINYFGGENLDCIIGFAKTNWKPMYDKISNMINKPYNLINLDTLLTQKKYYDYIIIDTEDAQPNWEFIGNYMKNYEDRLLDGRTKIFVVSHNSNLPVASYFISDKYITRMYIQGIQLSQNIEHYYYNAVRAIDANKKLKIIKRDKVIRVAVVGDIVNRDKNFIANLKKRITNYSNIEFQFISRKYSDCFISSLDSSLTVKLNESITATEMYNILFLCDYIYYYPEYTVNDIGSKATGSFNMAYSTLCKYICPIQFIEQYDMNQQCGSYLKNPNDSITLTKITYDDILLIEEDGNRMYSKTKDFIEKSLIKC